MVMLASRNQRVKRLSRPIFTVCVDVECDPPTASAPGVLALGLRHDPCIFTGPATATASCFHFLKASNYSTTSIVISITLKTLKRKLIISKNSC